MAQAARGKPILCIDFDGVIHSYERGWQNGVIYGTPVPYFFEWALEAQKFFELCVYSSRSKDPQQLAALRTWMAMAQDKWRQLPDIHDPAPPPRIDFTISHEKPPAFLTIDDRGMTFNGNWLDPAWHPEALLQFKPWNVR